MAPAAKHKLSDELMDVLEEGHLPPYVVEPEDIASLASFLASDEARFITGQEIYFDGSVLVRSEAIGVMKHLEN